MKTNYLLLLSMLTLLTCITPGNSFAQGPTIKWGTESDEGDKKSINFPIGWHDNNYYNLRLDYQIYTNKYEAVLEQMSESMKVISAKKLDYESKATVNFEYMNFDNETIYLYSSTYEGSEDKLVLYREEFNIQGKKTATTNIAKIPLEKKSDYTSFNFSESTDGKTISAFHKQSRKKGDPLFYQIVTFPVSAPENANLFKGQIKYDGYGLTIDHQEVDNEGKVVFVVRTQEDKKGDPLSYLLVYSDNEVSQRIDLEYNNTILDNFSIEKVADGHIKLAGLYLTKEKKKSFYQGFFLCTFDLSAKEIKDFSSTPFTKELISKFGKRAAKKGSANTSGNYHVQIVENNDGSGYVIAESRNIFTNGDKATHVFNEILVANYNQSGELTHLNLIPKAQADSYTRPNTSALGIVTIYFEPPYAFKKLVELFSSYSAVSEEGVLYIMFNDNDKNDGVKTLDDIKAINSANNEVTRLYSIDGEGKMRSKTLFDNKEKGGFFVTSKSYFKEKPYVVGLMKRKSIRYGTVDFR